MDANNEIKKYNEIVEVVDNRMNQITALMDSGRSLAQQAAPIIDSIVQLKRDHQRLDAQLTCLKLNLNHNIEKFHEIVRKAEERLDRQLDSIDKWTDRLLERDLSSLDANELAAQQRILEAIQMANENAIINNIENTHFIAGDTEYVLTDLIYTKKIKPDIIMLDPPRRGLDNTTINNILKIKPKKIVYISCNPASLVRDLAKLEEIYDIKEIQPFDMFPWTSHVECCSVLSFNYLTK